MSADSGNNNGMQTSARHSWILYGLIHLLINILVAQCLAAWLYSYKEKKIWIIVITSPFFVSSIFRFIFMLKWWASSHLNVLIVIICEMRKFTHRMPFNVISHVMLHILCRTFVTHHQLTFSQHRLIWGSYRAVFAATITRGRLQRPYSGCWAGSLGECDNNGTYGCFSVDIRVVHHFFSRVIKRDKRIVWWDVYTCVARLGPTLNVWGGGRGVHRSGVC